MKNLSHDSTFKEIKDWFLYHLENGLLPETLDGRHKYYGDVALSIDVNIKSIERQIELHGSNIKKSNIAKASKENLTMLYNDLQVKDNWNKPRPETQFI